MCQYLYKVIPQCKEVYLARDILNEVFPGLYSDPTAAVSQIIKVHSAHVKCNI